MTDIILFIFAFGILLFGLILLKKKDTPIPLVQDVLCCFLTELSIGAIAAKVYAICSVPVGLRSMGIAYLILGAFIWFFIIKFRSIQKFKFELWDIYSILIITIWFAIVFISIFTFNIENKYINSDPAMHLKLALDLMDSGKISPMHFGELFNGLILSIFEPFLSRLSLYKIYILLDAFASLINVYVFWMLICTFCKHKCVKVVLPFLGMGYFAGWPLFNFILGGFGYVVWGVTLFALIVYLLIKFYESEEKKNQLILIFAIGINCIGLAFCYMLFLPALGLIILLVLIEQGKKIDWHFNIKKLSLISFGILGMGSLVFIICFRGYFNGNVQYFLDILKMEGWTHKDLYRDFIFLLPPFLYMGWQYIKKRRFNIIFVSTLSIFAFVCFTFVLCLCNLMSSYYFYKTYCLLWFFMWIMLVDAMEYLLDKDKGIVVAYAVSFGLPFVMTITGADYALENKEVVVDEKDSRLYPSFYPILDGYAYYLNEENNCLEDKEGIRDISGYIFNNFTEKTEIPLIACDGRWGYWYYCFTNNDSIYVANGDELLSALCEYEKAGYEYVVIHQNSETYRKVKEKLAEYEKKYDNGYYGIYCIK